MDEWGLKADNSSWRQLDSSDFSDGLLIGGCVFLLPFLFSHATVDPVLLPRFVALSALLVLFVLVELFPWARVRHTGDTGILRRFVFPVLLIHLIVSGVSIIAAVNITEALFDWMRVFLSFVLLLAASLSLARSRFGVEGLSRAVAVTGLALGVIGFCQHLSVAFQEIPGNYGVYATMANKNLLASALFLTLPFLFYGLLQFTRNWRSVCFLSLTFVTYNLVTIQSRSVWLAILAASLTTLAFGVIIFRFPDSLRLDKIRCRTGMAWILLAASLGSAAAIIRPLHFPSEQANLSAPAPPSGTVPVKPLLSTATLYERILLWKSTWSMIADRPLIGVGAGQWKIFIPAYGAVHKAEADGEGTKEIRFQRPHNDFLWIFAETGIFGILSYGAFVLTLVYYALKSALHNRQYSNQVLSLAMLFGLVGYLVDAAFSFPRERVFHLVFFMLIAASVISSYDRTYSRTGKTVTPTALRAGGIAVTMILLACLVVGLMRLGSEARAKSAISAYRAANWEMVVSEIDQADLRFYNLDPTATPLTWYRGMAYLSLGNLTQALTDFESAERANPNHIHVLNNLATCYAWFGNASSALGYYDRALKIRPEFESARRNRDLIRVGDISH